MNGQQGARAAQRGAPINLEHNAQCGLVGWGMAANLAASVIGIRSAVMLAPSAYLASAADIATLVLKLLPSFLHHISDRSTPNSLAAWQSAVEHTTLAP